MNYLNVLALFKGPERFIFVYDDVSRDEAVAAIRNCAADPATRFNWFDAAVLSERAKRQALTPASPHGDADDAGTEPR